MTTTTIPEPIFTVQETEHDRGLLLCHGVAIYCGTPARCTEWRDALEYARAHPDERLRFSAIDR